MKLFTRIIFLMCIGILSVHSASGVTAGFTADYTAGCAPLVVHFTNTSSGASGYSWNLGNGTPPVTITNPSTTYTSPGTYTVVLTASNGSSSSTYSISITVYPMPTANFYANDTSVCPGTPVTFTSTSTGGVVGPLTYQWNFGDGYSSTATTPVHAFATPGNYNITLSAINAQGCIGTTTKSLYMHVFTPAAINFSAPTFVCIAPATVTFSNTTTGTPGISYYWSFGDGTFSTAVGPVHTYGAPGLYTVELVATDGNGCMDSVTRPSYIEVGNMIASFTYPATACVNSPVNFYNTSNAHTSSSWTFGDGGTATTDSGTHIYNTPGNYNVTLIISNGSCYDTMVQTITIQPGPTASFVINPAHACPAPVALTFFGSVPGGSSVTWLYGDGTTGSGTTSTHTYAQDGVDTIRMITVGPSGCIDTIMKVDTIYNMIFSIIDTPSSGCVPLTVHFSTSILTTQPNPLVPPHAYPYGISTYSWNFGDGSPASSAATPVHTYNTVGVYTVILTAVTGNGCTIMDTTKVYVGTPPTVTFTATPTHICAGQSVFFTSTHTGPVTDYVWSFGDGSSQIDSNGHISHQYIMPGVYSDTLIAYYNGCPSAPYIQTNYIYVDSPGAGFSVLYACIPPNQVSFFYGGVGATGYTWIFGDGTSTSSVLNPVHDYPSLTTYVVSLATYNSASGCRDTARETIDLSRPTPHFTADDTAVCKDGIVHFTPSVTGGTALHYYWYVNGVMLDDTSTNFTDTFHVTGIYTVELIIADSHGCYDTAIRPNYIIVAKPVDSFVAMPPIGCWPLTVTFVDHSTDVSGAFITNYAWTYGDGATSTVSTPVTSHTYTTVGTFGVQEIVTDNIGCKDTLIKPSLIGVHKAHASFYANTNHACAGVIINFTNQSTGIVSSMWYFGDGDSSSLFSPTHAYGTGSSFTVTLIVTDSFGCKDTASYYNYITTSAPHAGFNMSDTFSICSPLQIYFTNTSTGAVSYQWTFGNGNISVIPSPNNLYIDTGYYTIVLIATDANGCKDSVIKHADIFGYSGAFTYTPLQGCAPLTVYFSANISNVPSIIWDFDDGTTSAASTATSTSHIYTVPGAYIPRLILSDNTGCQNSSLGIDTIKVDAVKAGFTTSPTCIGSTVNFTDTSSSYWSTVNSWLWTYDGQTSTSENPSYHFNTVGTYTVTLQATDAWGCTATIVRDVTIYPLPTINAGPDTTICVGDAATLTATGGSTYVWSPGATLSCTNCNPTQASPTVVTNYTVTGTDIHGCVNTDTVSVLLKTKTVSTAGGGGEICDGVALQLFDSGATRFTWIPGAWLSNPNVADPVATPDATITYTVIAQLGSCIPDTNYVTIIVHPLPTVDAGPDQTLVAGSVAQLHATGTNIFTYAWTNASSLSCETCASPVANMTTTTTYIVDVATDFGCLASDSVTIHLYCDKSQIFIPNSFTPNGDGENDVFYPRGTGVTIVKSFRIYNRWGQLLFERDNIQLNDVGNAWDGSYQGTTPRPDVYVYIVDAVCDTGEPLFIKGDVTIIR